MIFCARQLQEKAREQQKPLYMVFYDLEKAFDSVPREAMWAVLKRFGTPRVGRFKPNGLNYGLNKSAK